MNVIQDPQPLGRPARTAPPAPDKTRVGDELRALIPEVRNRGLVQRTEWHNYHACWMGKKTRFYYAGDTADHYIPMARRHLESAVTRTRQLLTPFPDFFECYPWDEADPEMGKAAENAKAYVGMVMTQRTRLRSFVDQLARCRYLYGRAIAKTGVRILETQYLVGRQSVPIRQVWPTVRAVDPFAFYMWPETATHPEDATLIFEDLVMSWDVYQDHVRWGIADPIEARDLGKPVWPLDTQIRMAQVGLPEPDAVGSVGSVTPASGGSQATARGGTPAMGLAKFVALTEAWYYTGGRWVQSWLVWNVAKGPLQVRYNAEPLPEPPYRVSVARALPGEPPTLSMMSDLEPLNVWFNDQVNITQDSQWTAMSPPVLVNPVSVFDKATLLFKPRQKWSVDPSGVQFPTLPDTTRAGWQGVQAVTGLMESFSNANPLVGGMPTRGMPRAGFAVSTLISLSMADLKAVAEDMEEDLLTPILGDIYRLGMLYTPAHQRLDLPAVMNLKPRSITLADMVGNLSFKWVGSVQAQDFQVRAQRLVSTLGVLAKVAPQAMQQGLKIDWITIVKRIWRYGLGEMGADSIISQMTPEDAMLNVLMRMGPQLLGGGTGPAQGAGASPTSAEGVERGAGRQMSEGAVGQAMAGMGQG